MLPKEAVSEVFYTAFKTLTKEQKDRLLRQILDDPEFREDLIDLALIEQAKQEAGEPVTAEEYFSKRRNR